MAEGQEQNGAPVPVESITTTEPAIPEVEGNGVQDIADMLGLADIPESKPEGEEGKTPVEPKVKPVEKIEAKPQVVPGNDAPQVEESPKKEEPDLKTLLKEVLAENKPKAEPEKKAPAAEKPYYNTIVPTELMAAIEHEDPAVRQQGISALIGGAMNKVRNDMLTEMRTYVAAQVSQVPQTVEARQQAQREAQTSRDSFYSENPAFAKTPKTQQLVAMFGMQLAQSMGAAYTGFTPEFQAKLAEEFSAATGIPKGKAPVVPAETKPVKKPAMVTGASPTRAGDVTQSLSDEIFDVIGGRLN